ncbi:MAG: type II toxin-antitoxin system prevent-host-death family antitoxin [Nitrospirae bacterium]|nr:type II toxin-antitoxin system prevent-host-death family antitoxin [Nitrospirota bacterium]
MLRFINIHELHARTPQAIHQVERGAKIVITKRGKPKALLLPLSEDEIEDLVLASPSFLKSIKAADREGRRKGWRSLAEVRKELGLRDG